MRSLNLNNDVDSEAQRIDDEPREQYTEELEELTNDAKNAVLVVMFPSMKPFDVSFVLKKVGYNFGRAVEELLNHAFFEEEEISNGEPTLKKGIDAFAEPFNSRGRKARRKREKETRRTSSTPNSLAVNAKNAPQEPRSRWDHAKEDIEFISQRTHVSRETVTSAYHKAGASLPATIATLYASQDCNPYLSSASPAVLEAHISELASDFSALSSSQATALIRLTHPSTVWAHELARVLESNPSATPLKITPHYRPRPKSPQAPPIRPHPSQYPLPMSTVSHLTSARSAAFTQASAAHRKAKSTPLMGGAASYYSAVGRDASAALKRYEAAVAEALVASQSRAGEVDLHGVNVQEGVRIARERVQQWWGLEGGSEWAREGKVMGPGLRIVTGVGKHSLGGKGKLGPAVGAMLLKEGWKVEVTEGVVTVVGRTRR